MDYKEWSKRYLCKWKTQPNITLDRIVNAIQNKLPFSYVRICDGELVLLKEYFKVVKDDPYYIDLCNADNLLDINGPYEEPCLNTISYYARLFQTEVINEYFNNRWGITSDGEKPNIIKTIGENIIYAIKNSSLIGIWDIEKDILSGNKGDFYVWTHSYVPHIELFADCKVNFKNITSASVHREPTIGDPLKFREVLNGTPIHIFTSNEHELRNVTKLHELLQTEISYTNLTPIKGDPNSFSFMAHDLLNDRCKNIKEHVILYGLGYGAKYIPSYLSTNYGKCVLDMGAVLDGWAGKITRPYMKENTYMIPNLNDAKESWIP